MERTFGYGRVSCWGGVSKDPWQAYCVASGIPPVVSEHVAVSQAQCPIDRSFGVCHS